MEPLKINFKVPSSEDRKHALGAMGGENFRVKKALDNVNEYWEPKVPPEPNDWLAT